MRPYTLKTGSRETMRGGHGKQKTVYRGKTKYNKNMMTWIVKFVTILARKAQQ